MTRRQLLTRITVFSGAHFLTLALLNSLIFLLAHIPTAVVKLDQLIIFFTYIHQALTLPRWLLRQLWIGETTPTALNWVLTLLNSLLWGLALTWLTRHRWRNPWENAV
jgi:hypothetical protein